MKTCCILLFSLLQPWFTGSEQPTGTVIPFYNPSFEDTPRASASPAGWSSITPGSTPDIMPGAWGINFMPQDGQSCVGLITREDGTSEDMGQNLPETLKSGFCYKFSIYLAHSPKYVGYDHPIRIRIWGGSKRGSKEQLLASSPMIDHSDWQNYKFQFIPTSDIRYITFEAYYAPGASFKYKGNILMDNCSPIEKCNRA
jgi:hypothetical protein